VKTIGGRIFRTLPSYAFAADEHALIPQQVQEPRGFGRGRLLGGAVAHQFDAGGEAHAAHIPDEGMRAMSRFSPSRR
jgi:hypothetical protein